MKISTLNIQRRLRSLGFNPGPLDGDRGRLTIAAVKQFQRSAGLDPDGIVGPKTAAELFVDETGSPAAIAVDHLPDATPWLDLARRKLGLHEKRNNRALWSWLKSGGGSVGDPARIPWCGDFVETCIAVTLPGEALPSNPYWARNWAKFGVPCGPVPGAIASFTRGRGGHVGFVVAYDRRRGRIKILGGNQSNAITEAWLSTKRLIDTRWPATAMPPAGSVRGESSAGARLSQNEA